MQRVFRHHPAPFSEALMKARDRTRRVFAFRVLRPTPFALRITFYALRFAFCVFLLSSCLSSPPARPASPRFASGQVFVFRFSNPALVELSEDFQIIKEHPVSFPPDCGLLDIFPAPRGNYFAIELSCSFGQTVLFFDVETDSVKPAFAESDSHFLAWTNDGEAVYLKVDSSVNPRTFRVSVSGASEVIPISEFTYDLAPKPNSGDFLFTLSRGLGFGSELWLANKGGDTPLYADEINYLFFARWSPDGKQIAFVKIPDSQIPFTVGELWVVNADGTNPQKNSVFSARSVANSPFCSGVIYSITSRNRCQPRMPVLSLSKD